MRFWTVLGASAVVSCMVMLAHLSRRRARRRALRELTQEAETLGMYDEPKDKDKAEEAP